MSSDFLSRPISVTNYGLMYAGVQKNVGPAGVTVVIIREDMLERIPDGLHSMLDYRVHVAKASSYNTPPVFSIYMANLVTEWLLEDVGGLAKMSAINKNNRRIKLSNKFYNKRKALKKIIMNKKLSLEERFKAQQKLSKLPRNSSKVRIMNRCQITGRPHGVYRKLKISRIALRQLGLQGKIPGMIKSSW